MQAHFKVPTFEIQEKNKRSNRETDLAQEAGESAFTKHISFSWDLMKQHKERLLAGREKKPLTVCFHEGLLLSQQKRL